MASPKESSIERACRRAAEAEGYELPKLYPYRRGRPDSVLLRPRRPPVYVEFKTPAGRLSAAQKAEHERLHDLGFEVHVVRSLAEFRAILAAPRT